MASGIDQEIANERKIAATIGTPIAAKRLTKNAEIFPLMR